MGNVLTISPQSRELIEVIILVDKVKYTSASAVEVSVVRDSPGAQADVWLPAASVPGKIGYIADHMAPGAYRVFARITDGGFQPVRDGGIFLVK